MIEVWSISNLSNARYGATPWQPAPRQRQALKFAPMARRSSTLYVSRRKQELSAVKKTKVRVSHKTLECTRARLALGSFRPLGPAALWIPSCFRRIDINHNLEMWIRGRNHAILREELRRLVRSNPWNDGLNGELCPEYCWNALRILFFAPPPKR